jgi:hypothetical protein
MSNPIEDIRGLDLTAYRASRKLSFDLQKANRESRDELRAASRKAVGALRRRANKLVAPHRINWRDNDGVSINHTDWRADLHLSGELWPHNPGVYTRSARAHINFSLTGKDMEEFDEVFCALKVAADALAETLFSRREKNELV